MIYEVECLLVLINVASAGATQLYRFASIGKFGLEQHPNFLYTPSLCVNVIDIFTVYVWTVNEIYDRRMYVFIEVTLI